MHKSLTVLFLLALPFQVNANLVVNGSFENNGPGQAGWNVYQSIPGWTTVSGPGIEVRNNVAGTAQDGMQFVELDSHNRSMNANSSMQQAISTVLGSEYNLSFYYSPRINQPSTTNGISVFWNDNLLGNITGAGSNVNVWSLQQFIVMGTGNDLLRFAATGISDSYGGNIDNVKLSAVPVPGAIWLFASAMGLFGFLNRKQRA